MCYLQFRVQVYDDGEPNYIATARVEINVIINPSGPQFVLNPYARTIHETFTEGDMVVDTDAFDIDQVINKTHKKR